MTERERIRSILAFALRTKAPALKWKRQDDAGPDRVAEQLLQHLELSNVTLKMGPPAVGHSTPGEAGQ